MQSILIVNPTRYIGNLVVSLPVMHSIVKHYCDSETKITLVIDEIYVALAKICLPYLSVERLEFLPYPRKSFKAKSLMRRVLNVFGFIRILRRGKYDTSITLDLERVASLTAFFSGARSRYGSEYARTGSVYTHRAGHDPSIHIFYSMKSVAELLDIEIEGSITLSESNSDSVIGERLMAKGIDLSKKIIFIHAGAGKIYKLWSSEGFAKISDWLFDLGFQVVFIGAELDRQKLSEILTIARRPTVEVIGLFKVEELPALFSQCHILVSNDSGPMHIASMLQIPTIALYGPSDPNIWGPRAATSYVVRGKEPCDAECKIYYCVKNYACLASISVSMVKEAFNELNSKIQN